MQEHARSKIRHILPSRMAEAKMSMAPTNGNHTQPCSRTWSNNSSWLLPTHLAMALRDDVLSPGPTFCRRYRLPLSDVVTEPWRIRPWPLLRLPSLDTNVRADSALRVARDLIFEHAAMRRALPDSASVP